MALAEQTISLNFGGGVDTKTDPKLVVPAKCVKLQDCIFTNPKRISKRNGYNAMPLSVIPDLNDFGSPGTLTNPMMVKSYKNQFICAATGKNGQRLFAYSDALGAWSDQGKYLSIASSKNVIGAPAVNSSSEDGGTQNSSCAILGNIGLFVYDTLSNGSATQSYCTIVDMESGGQFVADLQIATSCNNATAVLLGSTTLAILYFVPSTGYYIVTVSVTEASGVKFGTPVLVSSTYNKIVYDIVNTPSGAVFAWQYSSSVVGISALGTTGSTVHTTTITSAGLASPLSITYDSTSGNSWIYWSDSSTTNSQTVYYAILSSTLTSVLGKTSIATSQAYVSKVTSQINSTTSQTCFVSKWTLNSAQSTIQVYPGIYSATVSSGGTIGGFGAFQLNADIYAKPVATNGTNYLACMFLSPTQATGFLLDTNTSNASAQFSLSETFGNVVAKFLPGSAEGLIYDGQPFCARYSNEFNQGSPSYFGRINSFQVLSSTQILLCCGFQVTVNTQAQSASNPVTFPAGVQLGMCTITFDFNNIDAYQGLIEGGTLVLNGSQVYQYDGASVTELGFNVYPDGIGYTVTTGSGNIVAGTYLYYVTYQWVDANGLLHQSAPSIAYAITTTNSSNTISITVQGLTLTQKQNVQAVLWRTINAGQIAYQVAVSTLSGGSATIVFSDAMSDSEIQVGPSLYTQGTAILENLAPPPAMIFWKNNNRVFCIDSENPATNIEYSKTIASGYGISFSTGQLELVIDSSLGNITGAIAMDEKTIILKEQGLYYFIGDGSNDAGSGQTFTNPQPIPSDVGCSNSKSVVVFPSGVLFRASGNKGVYLLGRGVSVQYFGLDVEAYNSQNILSSLIIGNRNQIRFLTSSGYSLLYDYVMNQWSVFTNHQGLSADTFNGNYTYVRTDGNIYAEDASGSYLDNGSAISPLALLSWIKASSIQNFQRARLIEMLGDFLNSNGGHGIQISVAYDFQPSFSSPVPYYFGATNNVYQYRQHLARQKCDSLQLMIQEITTGAFGEYVDFSDLGIEIAAKRGLNKLPANRSVG